MKFSKSTKQVLSALCLAGVVTLSGAPAALAQPKKPPLIIAVMTPKAGDKLVIGKTYPVTWSGGYSNDPVNINLVDVAKNQAVGTGALGNLKNDGNENFVIPVVPAGKYKFYVGLPGANSVHWGHGGVVDIVPPPLDVDVGIALPGGPKWNFASQQKVVFTVSAQTATPYSEIPVGGAIIVKGHMSRGLRVGDGKARGLSYLSSKRTGWLCSWGAWDLTKATEVECGLRVQGNPFKSGNFEIPVMPGINNIDWAPQPDELWKEEVRAQASLQSPLVDANSTVIQSAKVQIVGFGMGIWIPASNGGKWPVGSDQTLTLQPVIDGSLLMKEWIDSSIPMKIYTDLPSNVQFISATGTNWACTNLPQGGKIRVECTYTAKGTGQISYPKLFESVAVKMKVVSAGNFSLTAHCTTTPKFKLPVLPGKTYEPYTCNYDTTKITN